MNTASSCRARRPSTRSSAGSPQPPEPSRSGAAILQPPLVRHQSPEQAMTDVQALIETRPPSVAVLFQERVAATLDAEAYRHPVPAASDEGPDEWASLTWDQAARRVYAIAAGLIELGVRPEQRVALASTTRLEWILADLGM